MPGRVEGKIAVITGAARGQGRSHAIRLAEEGADIIALDVCAPLPHIGYEPATPQDLEQTAKSVESAGRRVVTGIVDVRDYDALGAAVARGVEQLGGLDIVVANAGICAPRQWRDVTPEMFRDIIDINLIGVWNTIMAGAPHLVSRGGGSIILTGSTGSMKGSPFLAPYIASKHGVLGLARAFGHELANDNVRVNAVLPTGVNTPMGVGNTSGHFQKALASDPRHAPMFMNSLDVGVVEPVDVSNAVLFLASDEARYVTTTALPVDAGCIGF